MSALPTTLVTLEDIHAAQARIRTTCLRTPVLDAPHPAGGAPLWIKAESLQRTGSFKLRGAVNAVAVLGHEARTSGVVTYSAGNHGLALASAARTAGASATVVMPETASTVKIRATRALGAAVELRPPDEFVAYAKHLATVECLALVPPFDDRWVIAGQGTVGSELLDQVDDVDVVVVPVGGGGLIAGIAVALKSSRPAVRVIGVEPALAGDLAEGYATGERAVWSRALTGRTIADGLRAAAIGELPWAHIMALVDDVVTVSEESIVSAMGWLATNARIVVEPSGAVVTGGNIDLQSFASLVGGWPTVD